MTARTFILGLAVAGFMLGCGQNPVIREARELRTTGMLPEARQLLLEQLETKPGQMDVWLEFARTDLDICRQLERAEDERAMSFLVEASLICGAYYRFKKQEPPTEWREGSRIAAAEVTKEANKTLTQLRTQVQSADYLAQLLSMQRGDSGLDGARMSAVQMVEGYRANARILLFQSVLVVRLLEMLPEVSSGSSTMLISQLQTARDEWRLALEIPGDLYETIQGRANRAVDLAMERSVDDLITLGYYVPGTIIDNGVLE